MKRQSLVDKGVAAGDSIFVLGFPMNLAGVQRNYTIVRQGVIARISEMLAKESKSFMADAFVFPGNSGGPVVLKPEVFSIRGTKSQPKAALIGMVTSYHPYSDVAISPQTNRARVLFEENSGLADVLPIDYVEETIRAWRSRQGRIDVDFTSSIPGKKP
jgi:Trypsin-like peptidase domain